MNKIVLLLILMVVVILPVRATDEVDSFELFWPMVAGKTTVDPVYPLKLLKENLRGTLIFGNLQKADYLVFLAVKRGLEIEKLIQVNNLPAAEKTTVLLQQTIIKASASNDQYKSSGDTDTSGLGPQMVTRLENVVKLFDWLSSKSDANKDLLQSSLDQAQALKAKL